jgi:hypothetical protein
MIIWHEEGSNPRPFMDVFSALKYQTASVQLLENGRLILNLNNILDLVDF